MNRFAQRLERLIDTAKRKRALRLHALQLRALLLTGVLAAMPLAAAAAPHDDEWCADAIDFAMGAAQNRALGYSLETINTSVEKDQLVLHKQVPALSPEDMRTIAASVFQNEWSRYAAANGMIAACLAQPAQKQASR